MTCFGRFGIALFVVFSVSLAVTSFPFKNGNSQYLNRMCDGIEEVTDNSTCIYGVWKNDCGKLACLSGVAEPCDEPRSAFRYGQCAHGLFCKCEKCHGCLNRACFSDLLCHVGHNRYPYAKRMTNYPVGYSSNNYNEY